LRPSRRNYHNKISFSEVFIPVEMRFAR